MKSIFKQFLTVFTLLAVFSLSSCTDAAKEENVTPEVKDRHTVSHKTILKDGDMVLLTWTNDRDKMSFVKVNENYSLDPNIENREHASLMKTRVVGDNKYAFEKNGRFLHSEGSTVVMSSNLSEAAIYMMNEDNSLVTYTSSAAMWVKEGIITIGSDYSVIDRRKIIVITEDF